MTDYFDLHRFVTIDEKKSAKDAPETAKDTSDNNPAQQDVKKEEKATGEHRLVFRH